MKNVHDVIIAPVISERSVAQTAEKKYTFKVARGTNKVEIRKAVEVIFGVKVESVNTISVKGRNKRVGVHAGKTSDWKKAIVKLTPDSKTIEFFEGMS